jgi:2-aminoadipate transaminase
MTQRPPAPPAFSSAPRRSGAVSSAPRRSGAVPSAPRRSGAQRVGSSAIRDLLRLTERPGILSLAGGLPAPDTFPVARLAAAAARVLDPAGPDAAGALQYGPTEGYAPLRAWIARRRGTAADDVVVTAGAQQALDLVTRALVERGDGVAVADPAYVGALQVLRLAGARVHAVPADAGGLAVDVLADRLRRGLRLRAVYTVSDLHNPTGVTLDAERRRALADLADHHGFTVIDDDPYGELRWTGTRPPALRTLTDRVVTLGSFSKIMAPGLRLGYLTGPAPLVADVVVIKQAADLHTASLGQRLVHEVVADGAFLADHLTRLRTTYRRRAEALAGALTRHLGGDIRFDRPDGGLFLWAELPGVDDTGALLTTALDHGVAFVPGAAFAVAHPRPHHLRLSFATVSEEEADEAARRLRASLLRQPVGSSSATTT